MYVAVAKWTDKDGLSEDICSELHSLGIPSSAFLFSTPIPSHAELVLTFAPWGRLLEVASQLANLSDHTRPVFIHWNLENPPDPRIPWPVLSKVAAFRSWIDRLYDSKSPYIRNLQQTFPLKQLHRHFIKYRYLGEYYYAYRMGWLDALVETSLMFTKYHQNHGLPTSYIPWGTARNQYDILRLERDIDVLWMGKRRTRRRSENINRIKQELALKGIGMYVIDGEENDLVYGTERTRLINRSRITLNVMSNWYDNSFHMRFHMAAGNGSMVVSEIIPPHYAEYESGVHYVSSDLGSLADKILYYLEHEEERAHIANNAFKLVSSEMTLANSLSKIIQLAQNIIDEKRSA